MKLPSFIPKTLQQLSDAEQLRSIPKPMPDLVDFSSNDYLGLGRIPWENPSQKGADLPMSGAGGARLLAGTHGAHLSLESYCASHFQGAAALLFNSGYQANVGVLSCLGQRGDTYIYDEACHASLKDGMRLSMAERFAFRHNDLADARRLLSRAKGNCYLVVESLYSMDGDWCDLEGLVALANEFGAWLIVDEAHSTGICGAGGTGYCVEKGFEAAILVRIYTFGKAIGRMGAVVVGQQAMVDYLVNRSRAWIYSTAMLPIVADAIQSALHTAATMDAERQQLFALRALLESALLQAGQSLQPGIGPIFPYIVPGNEACRALAAKVRALGFDVRAILAPTVPAGQERLRIVLHAFNTPEEIAGLARALTV